MNCDDRPTLAELYAESLCPECGEQRDWARDECVTLGCSRYLEVTNSLEREHVLAHARDTRSGYLGFEDESEVA